MIKVEGSLAGVLVGPCGIAGRDAGLARELGAAAGVRLGHHDRDGAEMPGDECRSGADGPSALHQHARGGGRHEEVAKAEPHGVPGDGQRLGQRGVAQAEAVGDEVEVAHRDADIGGEGAGSGRHGDDLPGGREMRPSEEMPVAAAQPIL
jgi:hypothetical protein